jgi:pyruvate-formate lyase-activating enzyme
MMPTETFSRVENCSLPIFRQAHPGYVLFYAPGYLVVVAAAQASRFEEALASPALAGWPELAELRQHANAAQRAWAEQQERVFAPLCLTVYLNNECNLGCTYCYSSPSPRPAARLSLGAIRAGAALIAQNCLAQDCGFTAVFHGGGEPTLHQALVDQALDAIETTTATAGLSLFRYVATNGVMSTAKATWLASRFDLVGLSCDGPGPIQAAQRPRWGGGDTSRTLERTAHILRELGKALHVRVTVTQHTLHRQAEIAEYVCQTLKPDEIHVEPVYKAGRTQESLAIGLAEVFATEFLKARNIAQGYGIPWRTSGSRPWEIHGPYCNIFRDVLNIVPGDVATACFKTTTADQAHAQELMIGKLDRPTGTIVLEQAHIQTLRQSLRVFPAKCQNCFNQYHCVRDCPDYCPLEGTTPASEFGCQFQKTLVNWLIQEAASTLYRVNDRGVIGQAVCLQ